MSVRARGAVWRGVVAVFRLRVIGAVLPATVLLILGVNPSVSRASQWLGWGGDPGADHYQADLAFSSRTVSRLTVSALIGTSWPYDEVQQAIENNNAPVITGGVAYSSTGISVQATNVSTATTIWSVPITPWTSPTFASGRLFVGTTSGDLVALSAQNGATLWSVTLDGQYPSDITSDGGNVIVTDGPDIYDISAATGAINWTYDTGSAPLVYGLPLSNQSTGGRDLSAAAVEGGKLFFVSQYFVFEISPSGRLLWQTEVNGQDGYNSWDGSSFSNPIAEAGRVYAAALAGDGGSQLEALNAESGMPIWQQVNVWAGGDMALANGVLYETNGNQVLAWDASTGATDWAGGSGGSPGIAVAHDVVFYNGGALDAETGASLWTNPLGCGTPITLAGAKIFCGVQGLLFEFGFGVIPQFTSTADATFDVGQSENFTVVTTSTGPAAHLKAAGLPPGFTFIDQGNGNGLIAGTASCATDAPCPDPQTWPVTITARIGDVSEKQVIQLTVEPSG